MHNGQDKGVNGPFPPPRRVPGARAIAVWGAVVTAAQTLVLAGYLMTVIFSYGLALLVFFIPLFVWLVIPWLCGNSLLPAPATGRRWAVVPLSAPISVAATWIGVLVVLRTTGLDHDAARWFLGDLVVLLLVAALVGAACWSLLGLVVRKLLVS